jgi:hypothetical protein
MPNGTTAHALAPSEEALDAPLSPPPLGDRPGPATGLSGDYPGGTRTRWSGPAFRTHHGATLPERVSSPSVRAALAPARRRGRCGPPSKGGVTSWRIKRDRRVLARYRVVRANHSSARSREHGRRWRRWTRSAPDPRGGPLKRVLGSRAAASRTPAGVARSTLTGRRPFGRPPGARRTRPRTDPTRCAASPIRDPVRP